MKKHSDIIEIFRKSQLILFRNIKPNIYQLDTENFPDLKDRFRTTISANICELIAAGRNDDDCTVDKLFKMAFQARRSSLLSPRPDFLGAGWGRERANTFFELFSLSFIPAFISKELSLSQSEFQQLFSIETHTRTGFPNLVSETSAADIMPEAEDEAVTFQNLQCCKSNFEDVNGFTNDSFLEKESSNPQSEMKESYGQESYFCTGGGLFGPENYSYKRETLEVFKFFQKLKISFKTEIYKTKEERLNMDKNRFYCKNLFLKDRKGQFYLIILHEDLAINLKQLRKTLNAHRNFNFATANEMMELLQTEPGGVTPLALMNASARDVTMVISHSLVHEETELMFHPMDSSLATKISLQSLLRYLKHFGHSVRFID